MVNMIVGIVVAVAVSLLILLAVIELICWYYRVNRIVKLLEENNELLRAQLNSQSVNRTPTYNE
jgi:predicted RND superfamily exporter protein